MSDIYENAVDSLKVGMQFFLDAKTYTSRKHSILTLFHAIELFLKEYLYRINPILIYKNIDKNITDDSLTVGIGDILVRLNNLNVGLPESEKKIIQKIQAKRNRIEHHRFDVKEEDEAIIAESLKFILYFVESILDEKLGKDIDVELLRNIQRVVFNYGERMALADVRLEKWLKEIWPEWGPEESDTPEEFEGTLDCPECRQTYLVIEPLHKPFCFWCNTAINAKECGVCGRTYLANNRCCE